ncbi:type VI secretion protein IcmF/TssM N-terminal domain-containing protein [Psychrosphaera algicola]|uniref:Type VI secretion protein IcmF/TssM N-terminal domain-containing protein n=1 Tax=Psychrosphaera algicola TaxID=3023714 RepID=A0ABT5FFR3_9GAMM|nr:type VI secretion protein IcmF/TssM N-terminal domain-containing protein [Psychrosphaera sp. G1-22]MDC2890171.1 type VI secretion protein IcmF/TssM N-terminal domain-containing protein [Psychrosphaera sp. G1-22]
MTKLLRQSYLKVHGDPMYVLPWYLVIGQNGSGKSFLLNEANLSSPTIDLQGLDKTEQDINWKLFNQGIALDVPSSYINSTDDNKNNPKWHLLLELLRKQRPKEPINGVVVTLTMEDLLGEKSQQLIEKAIESRRAIEQLMQQLSVVVPVYVVITHTDKMLRF